MTDPKTPSRVDQIKAELTQWLQPRLEREHAATLLALLETALDHYVADLGQKDARKMVKSAFFRAATLQELTPLRTILDAIANPDPENDQV
jgi:hypothetical protein